MNTKIVTIAMIAIVAIGLTGMASAGSTMNYDVDFSAVGTGSVLIQTYSPVGFDVQDTSWKNCIVGGHQDGNYYDGTWMRINRVTTITGDQNGNLAKGTITTTTMPTTPVTNLTKKALVQAVATYRDNDAYGSYVKLDQRVSLYDSDMPVVNDAGDEKAYVNTDIDGFAYGNRATVVSGAVYTQTDGSLTAATGISATVHDGNLNMDVQARITDNTVDRESASVIYNIDVTSPLDTADGTIQGYANVNGVTQDSLTAIYVNADISAIGYFYAVTI